jgi:periplasmic protein TonB
MARPKRSSKVYAISIGVHLVIGLAIAFIPKDKLKEIIAISMGESNKPKPQPPRHDDKPRETKTKVAARGPARGVTSPLAAATAAAAGPVFTDIGISMDASGSEGVAVATAPKAPPAPKLIALEPAKPKVLAAKTPDCSEALVKAKPVNVIRPEFSADARSAGVDGRVRVEVQVDDRGDVIAAKVVNGLGHGLDENSLDAAKRTHFQPATRCGKPVVAPFVLSFRFALST